MDEKIQERFANMKKKISKENKKMMELHGIEVTKAKPGRKKKVVKSCVLPPIPEGETLQTLESHRLKLLDMTRKGIKNLDAAKQLMDLTFPKRRRNVIEDNTRVWKFLEEYPCLKDDKGTQVLQNLYNFTVCWCNLCITSFLSWWVY